eukprot:GFKZ01008259.1.p1 GENE.GFKZ01008259.1~~GFKZ01008259.1.p1  ORF type:complete len:390 (+),score=54.54 GFKZ01008259.1:133-1302(+)
MVITSGVSAQSATPDNSALAQVSESQDTLDGLGVVLREKMTELHALQDAFETAVSKQAKMLKPLKSIRGVSKSSRNAERSSETGDGVERISQSDMSAEVAVLQARLKEMQLLMPATGGMFVEIFLGSINVRFARKSERLAFKKEYEKIKLKLAPVFAILCIVCLVFEEYRWLHMFLQLGLSCYYVTLAVRENILRANGSNIRAWWIIHHYFTMMQGVLLLTWPNGVSYARFRRQLHLFGLYNAILMIFQTRYQMARLYTLRSLGRANEMDVASSDSTQIHWSETMTLLLPLILFGQAMQANQARVLFNLYREFPTEIQILLLGLLCFANFVGNITTTMKVLIAKRAASKKPGPPTVGPASSAGDAAPSQEAQAAAPTGTQNEGESKKLS